MTDVTAEKIYEGVPGMGIKIVGFKCTKAAIGDELQISGVTTIRHAQCSVAGNLSECGVSGASVNTLVLSAVGLKMKCHKRGLN